ncbi:MAG: TlpA disulfide reductase family protein [Kangiellaceae bacterium]|jgi:thiol-disulfide isomerase/thioredoxin|nr:TlpA disulfide reductase family protein [Kangiellaceae bacterium]
MTKKLGKLKQLIPELLFFLLLFVGLQWWQGRDLLTASDSITAPIFQLPALHSDQVISNQTNNKPSIYYFFAPWCSVCDLSIENLNAFADELAAGKINLYIIALDWQSVEEVAAFVSQHQLPVRVLLGSQTTMNEFQIKGFPTYYVADQDNKLIWGSIGYSTTLGLKTRLALTKQ